METESRFFLHRWITVKSLVLLFLLTTIGVTLQSYLCGHFNNYYAYTRPILNLIEGKSLYEYYAQYYDDYYRYSPTFALAAGLLHYLNDLVGLMVWNLINTIVFVSGLIRFLKAFGKTDRSIIIALLIVYLEWIISCQNMQSNPLIAGLILWGAVWIRMEKPFWAALLFSICFFIKFYGIAAGIVFVFYPKKIQFMAYTIFWCVILAVLPLLVTSLSSLEMQYQAWIKAVATSPAGRQLSVMGIAKSWFGMDWPFIIIQSAGLALTLLPLIRFREYKDLVFQQLFLASVFVFLIIFNHMAESPTYVIAVTGIAIWFTSLNSPSPADKVLLLLMLVFCSNSNSDLLPSSMRSGFMEPYSIKALPCLLIWLKLQYQIWANTSPAEKESANSLNLMV